MKFCPLCRMDFEDDIAECPECKQELLSGLAGENPIFFADEREELVLKLYNFLCEQKLTNVQYYYNSSTLTYEITIADASQTEALQNTLLEIEYNENTEFTSSEKETLLSYFSDDIRELHPDEGSKTFVNAREKYEDVFSSAVCLVVVSVLGFLFMIATKVNIIPLNLGPLFYIFSSIMFLAFFGIGIATFLNAKKIKASISTEDDMAEKIRNYFSQSYKPLSDTEDESVSEEELYYSRTAHMRDCVNEHISDANTLLVDAIIDDIYNDLYPSDNM